LKYINFNGSLQAAENGDIDIPKVYSNNLLFETILVENGVIQLADLHFTRLFKGLSELKVLVPVYCSPEWIREQVLSTVNANNSGEICRVRVWVYAENASPQPRFIFQCFTLKKDVATFNPEGLTVGISRQAIKNTGSNLKTWDPQLYEIAAAEARANGWNDVLIKNTAGNIIESGIANVFVVKDNMVYTPPLADGCVDGVMRRYIIEKLAARGIRVIEKSITENDLHDADEIFLSNAIRRIKWVSQLGNRVYRNTYSDHLYKLLFDITI